MDGDFTPLIIKDISDKSQIDQQNTISMELNADNNNSYENGKDIFVKILHEMSSVLDTQKNMIDQLSNNMSKLDKELNKLEDNFLGYSDGLDCLRLKINETSRLHRELSEI